MNTIGIIGAGQIGSAIAQQLARLNIEATIANSRGPESLKELVQQIGPLIMAGTREEDASKDIVFLAVPWVKLDETLAGLPDFGGRIVVDTTNPLQKQPLPPIDIDGQASSVLVSRLSSLVRMPNPLTANLTSPPL